MILEMMAKVYSNLPKLQEIEEEKKEEEKFEHMAPKKKKGGFFSNLNPFKKSHENKIKKEEEKKIEVSERAENLIKQLGEIAEN
jgi:hypothetical protein